MKKTLLALAAVLALTACSQPANLATGPNGEVKHYPTYGFFNQDELRSDKVCYRLSVGNVVWSVLLIETIIAPVYFVGFDLFEPVSVKNENGCKQVD